MNLPLATRALVAAKMSGAPIIRVFVLNAAGQWVGVGESDRMHSKAIHAARSHGWSGCGKFDVTNSGGVTYRVMEDK
jgi:hypothetical protein